MKSAFKSTRIQEQVGWNRFASWSVCSPQAQDRDADDDGGGGLGKRK
jgi:hypothetical protein